MAINTEMVGQTFGPFVRDYTFRDLELFALGCGAGIDGKDGLEYLNERDERDPQLKVLPMFGAMLQLRRIAALGLRHSLPPAHHQDGRPPRDQGSPRGPLRPR